MSIILQNLVQTASSILDIKYKDYWDRITDLTGETAEDLMLSVDRYIATLAHSQEDTYTSPFEVVTDNMGESSFIILYVFMWNVKAREVPWFHFSC